MNGDAWLTLGVMGLVFGLLAGTQVSPDVILCGGVPLLVTLQVLTPAEAIAGMANEGMVTVALLFIVAVGLRETGGMAMLMQPLLGHPRSLRQAQTRLMTPVVVMSAFLNNTPLVAMLLPVASDWGRRYQLSVSKLLMPLSFASILGGTCTLIGTSTNLLISALLAKEPGLPRLQLLDMAWVGLPCAVAGCGFLLLGSRWLLPERLPASQALDDAKEYTIEMLIEPGGALEGQTIEQAGLRNLGGMYLMEINRDKQVLAAVSPHERLRVTISSCLSAWSSQLSICNACVVSFRPPISCLSSRSLVANAAWSKRWCPQPARSLARPFAMAGSAPCTMRWLSPLPAMPNVCTKKSGILSCGLATRSYWKPIPGLPTSTATPAIFIWSAGLKTLRRPGTSALGWHSPLSG